MTAKQIDKLSIEDLEQLAETLTSEEKALWADWGYDGLTYVRIISDRKARN